MATPETYPHALQEVQELFRRQFADNAIDVFVAAFKRSTKKIDKGDITAKDWFPLFTPEHAKYDDRSYYGSKLSFAVAEYFNEHYGILALSAELKRKAKRTVSREIVRAFIKNYMYVVVSHFDYSISGQIVCCDTLVFPTRHEFFANAFDPVNIRKQMRQKPLQRLDRLYQLRLAPRNIVFTDPDAQVESFLNICNQYGLSEMTKIVENLAGVTKAAEDEQAMKSVIQFLQMYFRDSSSGFYKSVNRIFE